MNKKLLISIFMFFIIILVACEQEINTQQLETKIDTEIDTKEVHLDSDSLDKLTVHYIDAGQADATLLTYTSDDEVYNILYDVGDWNKSDVINYLEPLEIDSIDLIIISHPHADHMGQLEDIIKNYDVGEIWMSGNESSSGTFQAAIEAILASNADYHEPRTGEIFDIGPLEIEILHPSNLTGDLNRDSVSLRFTYGDISFIFTGDAYKVDEQIMLQDNSDIQATFLQLGHHGSKTSSDPAFIRAVDPEVAIYSAGTGNSYGHPDAEIISLINNADITLYGTDKNGTIVVTTDGQKYDIETDENNENSLTKKESNNDIEETPHIEMNTKPVNEDCININEASLIDLQEIIHIGSERAQELIDKRPYDSLEDLTSISGIGPARITDIKAENKACVGG